MNLNRLAEFVKSQFLPILIVGATVVLTGVGIWNLYTYIEKGRIGQEPLPPNVEIKGKNYLLPTSSLTSQLKGSSLQKLLGRVATYKASLQLSEDKVANIASKLGIQGNLGREGETLVIRENRRQLTYDPNLNRLSFSLNPDPSTITPASFNEEEIKQKAVQLTQELGLLTPNPEVRGVNYYDNSLHYREASKDSAHLAVIILGQKIESVSLLNSSSLTVDQRGRLISFAFYPTLIEEKVDNYRLKSLNEIENDIKAKNVKITGFPNGSEIMDEASINSVNFNEITLGYIDQPKNSLIQPVFILKGDARIKDSTEKVEAVMPAIAGVKISP